MAALEKELDKIRRHGIAFDNVWLEIMKPAEPLIDQPNHYYGNRIEL